MFTDQDLVLFSKGASITFGKYLPAMNPFTLQTGTKCCKSKNTRGQFRITN